jgi:hypothetical protein
MFVKKANNRPRFCKDGTLERPLRYITVDENRQGTNKGFEIEKKRSEPYKIKYARRISDDDGDLPEVRAN